KSDQESNQESKDAADDQPASEKPASTPAPEKPASPAEADASQPAATGKTVANDGKAEIAEPAGEYYELDDLRRMEIRGRLLTEKTLARMRAKIEQVQSEMRNLGLKLSLPEDSEERITPEQAENQLREYARSLGLGRRNEETGKLEDAYVVT